MTLLRKAVLLSLYGAAGLSALSLAPAALAQTPAQAEQHVMGEEIIEDHASVNVEQEQQRNGDHTQQQHEHSEQGEGNQTIVASDIGQEGVGKRTQ